MPAQVLRGTKQEIVDELTPLPGEVREAIVFVEEPASAADQTPGPKTFSPRCSPTWWTSRTCPTRARQLIHEWKANEESHEHL